jgi:hypothetical protein
MAEELEVFQEMALHGPITKRPQLREALLAAAAAPWRADIERSAEIARSAVTSGDVILFRREAGDDYRAAGLTLWETNDGYYVPNIVPSEGHKLTHAQYNAILADFVERVAAPVAERIGFTIITTKARQSLSDWLSADAALKLQRFSGAANKSTGSSHPADERRWFDFLVAAHRSENKLGADILARWLHEVEGWDDDSAHELAGDFETSLSLLAFYDDN